jgi:polar amino acid transport system substrate-binding protein
MKRRWIGVLGLVAVFAIVTTACSSNDNGGGGSASSMTLEKGTLQIGSDMPYRPFEFETTSGAPTGFDVELMNAIADRLDLKPVWVNANFDTIVPALAGNRFDVIASAMTAYAPKGSPAYSIVTERATKVSFSKPYYDSLQSLTINKAKTPDITSVDQLKSGDRVGIQRGSTGAFWAEENLAPKGVELVSYTKVPDMYNALEAGQLVGAVNDLPVSLDAIQSKPTLTIATQISTGEQYAFAVNQKNTQLLDAIDQQLQAVIDDGTYLEIFQKYFPDQEPPSFTQ